MIHLTREGAVFVLRLDAGENRFATEAVAELNARLDEVEKADGAKALVTTGTGKFYSNGLDLDFSERGRTCPSCFPRAARHAPDRL